jgi:hypothetical protein
MIVSFFQCKQAAVYVILWCIHTNIWLDVCDHKGSRPVKELILTNGVYLGGYTCCNREYISECISERAYEVSRVEICA